MNEQQEFAKRINDLVELSADQENVIFEDQLFDIFPEVKDDSAKYDVIKDFLKEKKIGLNEKLAFEDVISEDEKNYLDFYLEDLNSQPKLTPGEREAFIRAAMAGDEAGQMMVLQDYLLNVVEIAKLYAGQGVLLEDLIGEGNVALVTAVTLLGSLEKPSEVEGFLASQVMDAMQDIIAEAMDETGAEEKLLDKVNKVAYEAKEMSESLGRKVTVEELSAESGISKAQILKALKLTANAIDGIEIPNEDEQEME